MEMQASYSLKWEAVTFGTRPSKAIQRYRGSPSPPPPPLHSGCVSIPWRMKEREAWQPLYKWTLIKKFGRNLEEASSQCPIQQRFAKPCRVPVALRIQK